MDTAYPPVGSERMKQNRDRVNKNVNELSKKLLEGWTLLCDSCPNPDCNVPLVQNKEKQIYCTNCEMFCVREEDIDTSKHVVVNAPASQPVHQPFHQSAPLPQQTSPASSRAPSSPHRSPHPPNTPSQVRIVTDSTAAAAQSKGKAENPSLLIAQKLLAGWKLLNEYCPNKDCAVPLFRDNNGQMYCVSCDNWVIKEEEYDPSRHQIIGEKDGVAVTRLNQERPQLPHKPQSPARTSPEPRATASPQRALFEAPAAPSVAPVVSHAPVQPVAPTAFSTPSATHHDAPGNVVSSTTAVLYRKMDEARKRLEATTSAEEMKNLCGVINECSAALNNLKQL